jgi:hypothetical protein
VKKILLTSMFILILLVFPIFITVSPGPSPPIYMAADTASFENSDLGSLDFNVTIASLDTTGDSLTRGSPAAIVATSATFEKNCLNVFADLYTYVEDGHRGVWTDRHRAEMLKLPTEALAQSRFTPETNLWKILKV